MFEYLVLTFGNLLALTGYSSSSGSTPQSPSKEPKEAEVDALTNLLMQNMEAAADPDFFGKSLCRTLQEFLNNFAV